MRLAVSLLTASLLAASSQAAPPAWWSDSQTQILAGTSDNHAVANLGQLKYVAKQAEKYLNLKLAPAGGAGDTIRQMVSNFEPLEGQEYTEAQIAALRKENYAPINLGQLKAVAKPFYDRLQVLYCDPKAMLITHGYPSNWGFLYPWNPATPTSENYGPVNLGQLKMVFSFDLTGTDTDGDGLPNGWEIANGSNPLVANGTMPTDDDIDDDQLIDGWEIAHGSNPLVPNSVVDSDSDGLTNLQEQQAGTDPFDADTDNDGMKDGWELTYGFNPLVADGGGDADMDGLTNLKEFEINTNPLLEDTDGDGMSDYWEHYYGLTNPRVSDATADLDRDGLTNEQEKALGTYTYSNDTDGDGLWDSEELGLFRNPLVAESPSISVWRFYSNGSVNLSFARYGDQPVSQLGQLNRVVTEQIGMVNPWDGVPWTWNRTYTVHTFIFAGDAAPDYAVDNNTGSTPAPSDFRDLGYPVDTLSLKIPSSRAGHAISMETGTGESVSLQYSSGGSNSQSVLNEGGWQNQVDYVNATVAIRPGVDFGLMDYTTGARSPKNTTDVSSWFSPVPVLVSAGAAVSKKYNMDVSWKLGNVGGIPQPSSGGFHIERQIVGEGNAWVRIATVQAQQLRLNVPGPEMWFRYTDFPVAVGKTYKYRISYFYANFRSGWTVTNNGSGTVVPNAVGGQPIPDLDSDTDQIPDWWELKFTLGRLDPTDALGDLDGDGLTNLAEFLAGSYPNVADSDGDGHSDSQDAYPLDPNRWYAGQRPVLDTFAPRLTLTAPIGASLVEVIP